ncbi:helix-turn-helix domain-containing protein [Rhizobium sp. PAMB 3174]
MSIKVMNLVFENGPAERNQFMVLLALADWADDKGRAYPGIEAIARKSRCSVRTVQDTLKRIKSDGKTGNGLVKIDTNAGPGGTNRYTINLQALATPIDDREADEKGGADFAPPQISHPAENDVEGVQNADENCTQTIRNPQSAHARTREPDLDDGVDAKADKRAFLSFVNNWPGFAGLSQDKARREWGALSPDDRKAAAAGRDAWIALLRHQGKDHTPAPSTYLRERLWEAVPDEPLTAGASV